MYAHERVDSMPEPGNRGSKYQWLYDLVETTVDSGPVRILFPDIKTLNRHRSPVTAYFNHSPKHHKSTIRVKTSVRSDEAGLYLYIQAYDGH